MSINVQLAAIQASLGATQGTGFSGTTDSLHALAGSMGSGFLTVNNNLALSTTSTRRLIVTIPSQLFIPTTGNAVYCGRRLSTRRDRNAR